MALHALPRLYFCDGYLCLREGSLRVYVGGQWNGEMVKTAFKDTEYQRWMHHVASSLFLADKDGGTCAPWWGPHYMKDIMATLSCSRAIFGVYALY